MDAHAMRRRIEELEEEVREYKRLLFCPPLGIGAKLGIEYRPSQALQIIFDAYPGFATKDRLAFLWDYSEQADKSVDVAICKIRRRLKELGVEIITVHGRGYRLDAASKARLDAALAQFDKEPA